MVSALPMKSKHLLALLSIVAVVSCGLWLATRRETPADSELEPALTESTRGVDHATPASTPTVTATVPPTVAATFNAPETRPDPDAVREPQFTAFEQWLRRYEQADNAAKAALEAEGKTLAQQRLTAFADLVQSNPERALQLALTPAQQEILPAALREFLETPLNAKGDLAVIASLPMLGQATDVPPVFRTATVGGESYSAFTFGAGLQFVTKQNVPLNGYAVPTSAASKPPINPLVRASRLLVLNPDPARRLAQSELEPFKRKLQGRDVLCSVSGESWGKTRTETAAKIGDTVFTFCGAAHLRQLTDQVVAAAGLTTPSGAASLLTAESSYTEGRKRVLLMRPYWTNQAVAMTTNAAIAHFNNFSNYMWQMSYGKLRFASFGPGGSDISTELLIPGGVNSYISGLGNGPTDAWKAVKDVATTNYGYDLSKYDFLYYVTAGQPAATYAGLGFVGGVGFHLANSYFDAAVTAHEFGHNLGLNHAHFWDTSQASIIGSGQNIEYGDGNDPMGGGGNPNQYNSRYKNQLGWITDSDIATLPATGSNRYRLYAFDGDYSVGLRGLKYASSGTDHDNYWINFRQRKTGSPALMNGVQLLWTGNGNSGSYLLDVRLKGNSDNNAIVIGRTFSDARNNFHFTPIGKGNTYPESMDVVVVTGVQAGNLPPIATLGASTLTPSPAQAVTFSASASDPNGDTLAYYWEFGDGVDSYSSDNKPVQTHSFATAGEYAVRCVVSDLRGGTAQHTLLVRVGNPSVFGISGHVTDQYARPMAGALVRSGGRSVFVDSDGSYVIPGLAAGSYTLSALETVNGAVELVHPFWNNPVVLGPSAINIDFIVGTSAPPATLVGTNATWKYLDNGTDQGTNWQTTGFDDSGWASGPSQLGYGEGDEATTNSFGPTAANKYITTYYRNHFNISNPASLTNVIMNLLRDDGVIVYLNGTEVFRDNMPAGAPTYTTLAPAVAADDGKTFLTANLSPALLIAGDNVIAAEIHQDAVNSSDITFYLSLDSVAAANVSRSAIVYVNSPTDNANYTSPTNLTITASAFSTPTTVTNVEIYDGAILLGASAVSPYSAPLNSPANGLHILRAISRDSAGISRTSAPVNITVSAPATPPIALTLVTTGAVWRYSSASSAAAVGWQNLGFNDGAWSSGPARLGFNSGNVGLATVIDGGPAGARYPTAYFRHAFVVNDPTAVTNLTVQLARDDGAVVYLNGVEILRDNITNGVTPTYSMLASNATDSGATYFTFVVPSGGLVPGTNVLAAEVHQTSPGSSDLIFDLGLSGLAATNRARGCWLTGPANGASSSLPGSVTLNAQIVVGGNLGVANVEFYSDGALLGSDASSPFSFTWNNPPGGAHSLVAVGLDSAGGAVTSAPVNITVTSPPSGDALISFGDVWKYLDDGSNPSTTWKNSAFNDNPWMAGPGKLGYGGDGELTTVSYGTNANFKHITTYFRKKFVVANPASFSGLLLRLVRDDGAVVYLNGTEIYRTNLLAGPVSDNSLATPTVSGADETTPIDVLLATTGLLAGTNTLAVEMHQDTITSSDLGFDLALIGLRSTNTTHGLYLTSPGFNAHYNMPAMVALTAYASSTGGVVTLVEYYDGAAKVGQSVAVPYAANWSGAAAGLHTLTAVATYGAGLKMTSPASAIVVGSAPPTIAPVFTPLISSGSAWKYWDSATAVSNGWSGLAFEDAAWPAGNGRFGWGLDGEATLLTSGRITHYFRKTFVITNGGALDSLTFNVLRDDGVVVYFNGLEVFRTNLPAGPVDGSTLASVSINTPDETIPVEYTFPTAASGLLHGTNVVAVELHQSSGSSSDAGFDLSLYGEGTTETRVYMTTPANGSAQVTGLPIAFEAQAQAPAGRTLAAVEFFSDGTNFGQASALPYRVIWSGASAGLHTITARALDNLGASITSAPVQISVGYQTVSLVLVPSNSIWKYLDNGSNQGTNWAQTNYSDVAWASGPAQLGYGLNGEDTTVGYGPSQGNKYITTYFRHSFVVPPDTFITNLTFRLVRDDGAVVWLNGREMYRSNMPNGTITNTTPASVSVGNGPEEQTFFATTLGSTNVFPGTNVVAVEMHQSAANSSDLSFNLEVDGSGYLFNTTPPILVAANAGGLLRITWPASAAGYQLYSRAQLGTGSWQLVGSVPTQTNGFNVLSIPMTNAAAFYHLEKP